MVKTNQILIFEERQPLPLNKSVERNPYQKGKNLSISEIDDLGSSRLDSKNPVLELEKLHQEIRSDECVIEHLIVDLKDGGTIKW